jgi:hypothetical protein
MLLREREGVRSLNFDSFRAWVNHERANAPDLPVCLLAAHPEA